MEKEEAKLQETKAERIAAKKARREQEQANRKAKQQRQAEFKQKALDAKVERLRANGGLLVEGGAL